MSSSCSQEQVAVEPDEQLSISFSGNLQDEKAMSRADKGLEEVLNNKTFKVWSYKNTAVSGDDNYTDYQNVMLGYTVDYETNSGSTSNTHDWEYVGKGTNQDIKYWDFSAKAYRFFAYALGNGTASAVTEDDTDVSKVSFTTSVDCSSETTMDAAPYFTELWFSTDKVNDYGKVVTLKFLKPYARVRFLFVFNEGLDFGRKELERIKFYPAKPVGEDDAPTITTAGNVTVIYPLKGTDTKETWSTTPTGSIPAFTIDWYETPEPAVIPEDELPTTYPNTPEKWYYVLPVASQGSYIIEAAIETNELRTASVPAEYMTWKAGFEYTYVFRITEGGILLDVIQVAVNDWETRILKDHTVYNW